MASGSTQHSKEFFELIRAIGESKSKQEEDRIILKEVQILKAAMGAKDVPPKKMKEFIMRMIYCEMLGHCADFGYIHAINLTSQSSLLEKRVGYLGACLCVPDSSDLRILCVAPMHKDLRSSNYLEVCAALGAACKLVSEEAVPALLPTITGLLSHSNEAVRKKAVMALHSFYKKSTQLNVSEISVAVRRALCDKDPAVMGASLNLLYDMTLDDPTPNKDLVPSLVNILRQITEHRLPRDFDYHRMPAPWLQVRILKTLSLLGADDQATSEQVYDVLGEVMRRADSGINIGHAVIYETVRAITSIYPNTSLLEAAALAISRFITSESHNLKYLGITALAAIVQINAKYAVEHQMVVIECLEDTDVTLQRKTLDLLYRMTNPANVVVIVEKMITFLKNTVDVYLRSDLVGRICQLADKYAPDNYWYIDTMNQVFELGGNHVSVAVVQNLLRLVADGTGEDEEADREFRVFCVGSYYDILEKPVLPDVLTQVAAWVLGEYGYLSTEIPTSDIIEHLCDSMERSHEQEETRSWIVTALTKLIAQTGVTGGDLPEQVLEVCEKYSSSKSLDLQQRCYELMQLVKVPSVMQSVLPHDGSTQELEIDVNLSFLNSFVEAQLRMGAKPYSPPEKRLFASKTEEDTSASLKYKEYSAPVKPSVAALPPLPGAPLGLGAPSQFSPVLGDQSSNKAPEDPSKMYTTLKLDGVKRMWGPEGYNGMETKTPLPPPPAASVTTAPLDSLLKPSETAGLTPSAPSTPESAQTTTSTPSGPAGSIQPLNLNPAKPDPIAAAKQQLASAMFAGLASDSGSEARRNPRMPASRVQKTSATPGASSPAPVATAVTSPAQPLIPSIDDLLDFSMPKTTPPAPTQAAPVVAQQQQQSVASFFAPPASMQSPTSGMPSPAKPPMMSTNPLDDPFSMDMLSQPRPAVGAPTMLGGSGGGAFPGVSMPVAAPSLESKISAEIATHPQAMRTLLQGDVNIKVFATRVFKPDCLALLLTVESQARMSIAANVMIQPPAKVNTEYEVDSGSTVRGNAIALHPIMLGRPGSVLVRIRPQDATFGSSLVAVVTYTDERRQMLTVNINAPISATDLIRPKAMNTAEFGGKWGAHASETKANIPLAAAVTPQAFMARIQRDFNLHPVEIIGTEAIAAGCLVGHDQLVLMHCKVTPTVLQLTIRSRVKTLSDLVTRVFTSSTF